jgi:gluconolactonase
VDFKNPVRPTSVIRSLAEGMDHPEGVAWFEGHVYTGDEQGRLIRVDPTTGSWVVAAETGGFGQGIAFDGDGNCYYCDGGNSTVWRIAPDATVTPFVTEVEGRPILRPNFPVFGPDGTLWCSESGTGWSTGDGYLWMKRPGQEPRVVSREAGWFTNGLAIDPQCERLFVIESTGRPGVCAFEFTADGLGSRQEVVSLPGTVPDGSAFDVEGNLYIACWRPDSIVRHSAGGRTEVYVHDPEAIMLKGPTNLAFGGADMTEMFIPEFSGWSVRALTCEIPGQSLHRPHGVH